MGFDVVAKEVLLAALLLLASILGIIAKQLRGGKDVAPLPSEQMQVDLRPIAERIDASEKRIRRDLAAIGQQSLERIDQHERQVQQTMHSLAENLLRQQREKEGEDRRQIDRLHDKLDRMRNGQT